MKKYTFKRIISLIITAFIVLGSFIMAAPEKVQAGRVDLVYLKMTLDDGPEFYVPAYEASAINNLHISLRELSKKLSGSALQYNFYNDDEGQFIIERGLAYNPDLEPKREDEDGKPIVFEREEMTFLSESAYWTSVDGQDVVYYTYADYNLEDLYMSLLDVQLLFDIKIDYESSTDTYNIHSDQKFHIDLNELDKLGYFDYLHGVVLGDATTGEIIYSCKGKIPAPIASTTKLMTYFIVQRFIEMGKISPEDYVTISAHTTRQSQSDDAVFVMYEGEQISVQELLCAMMIQSSNESALALAEYAAGTEENFVELMNKMAFVLGLRTALFHNPHGLPTYYKGDIVTMVENKMSAEDLFKLARAILLRYPQVTEITTQETMWLEDMWVNAVTTNSLLYNMNDLIGLKTGTTDAAQSCLVSARKVNVEGEEHILVGVVLGAESNRDRVQVSELLLKSQGY